MPALLLLGGKNNSKSGHVEVFNLGQSSEPLCGETVPDLPHYQSRSSSTITADGKVVVCGGETPGQSYSQLCYYLPAGSQEWQMAPNLPAMRRDGYMVTAGRYVAYLGGYRSYGRNDIFFTHDSFTQSWRQGTMYEPRYQSCAVVVGTSIYITGLI